MLQLWLLNIFNLDLVRAQVVQRFHSNGRHVELKKREAATEDKKSSSGTRNYLWTVPDTYGLGASDLRQPRAQLYEVGNHPSMTPNRTIDGR